MVNFYIKGMSTTEDEQQKIISNFKDQGIDVIPVIDDYTNYSIKTIIPYIEKFINDNNPNNEEVNLICHSMGCNFGYLLSEKQNSCIDKIVYISPEFVGTSAKEKQAISERYNGIDYNTPATTKPNLHNIILYYKSLKEVIKLKNKSLAVTNNSSLIVYSKGDIFVNQNWINSSVNYLADKVEIESNSHNPLLTNMETYEEVSQYIKKSLTKSKFYQATSWIDFLENSNFFE